MKTSKIALVFAATVTSLALAPSSFAQAAATPAAAPAPAVGAKVFDTAGAEVGTIKSISGPNFVIDTGKNTATLALASLGTSPKGPIIAMTREQLDAAVEKAEADAAAALAAAITVDAPVHAPAGTTVLGKITDVGETDFVMDTGSAPVKMPKTSVAKGANGLMIGMTAEQFAEATKGTATPSSGK